MNHQSHPLHFTSQKLHSFKAKKASVFNSFNEHTVPFVNKYKLESNRRASKSVNLYSKEKPKRDVQCKDVPLKYPKSQSACKRINPAKSPLSKAIRFNESAALFSTLQRADIKKINFMTALRNKVLNSKTNANNLSKSYLNCNSKSVSHDIDNDNPIDPFHFQVQSKIVYHKIKSLGSQQVEKQSRIRSKTFAKSFVKEVQANLATNMFKTLSLSKEEEQERMAQSLQSLENHKRQSNEAASNNHLRNKTSQIMIIDSLSKSSKTSKSSVQIVNTQIYQSQIAKLTKKFLTEWQDMNTSKDQVYKQLRAKFISKFPSMMKHYPQFQIQHPCNDPPMKKQTSQQSHFANKRSSNAGSERTKSQGELSQEKRDSKIQKQLTKAVYKQTYFWSRTKGKQMTLKFSQLQQQKRQMENLQRIQKSLTFMKYIRNKSSKSAIMERSRNIKGKNILKNHQNILQMQKQGSKQQILLKRCLDNAIQGCIRDNM